MVDDNETFGAAARFHLSEDDYLEYLPTFNELQDLANTQFEDMEPFDGFMENNVPYQIRTGIIQDPKYEIYKNRVDENGNPIKQNYSVLDETKEQYPLNGINAVDVYGFRVSILWIDGDDGGLHHNANLDSTIEKPTQKLILTFPQVWADRDRNCGDLSLPVVGTIIRVGMIRSNIGMYLGSVASDKSKMPIIKLGDFMRRHYNQNTHYITDQTMKESYQDVLDKDIYKDDQNVVEFRPDTEKYPKPYETDTNKLSNLHRYYAHRQVISNDGISESSKLESNKHKIIDAKRVFSFNTKLSFEDAIDDINDICDPVTERISSPDGILEFNCEPDGDNLNDAAINIVTSKKTLDEILELVTDKIKAKSGKIIAKDATLDFTCKDNYSEANFIVNSSELTLLEIENILTDHFDCSFTRGLIATTNDAIVTWNRRIGEGKSSITSASSIKSSIFNIMGRPGKWYKVEGPDEVLTGDCPRTGSSEDTCPLPNA